ncbi:hypothetical protein Q7P37_010448 [Cladosporium fusiforme]
MDSERVPMPPRRNRLDFAASPHPEVSATSVLKTSGSLKDPHDTLPEYDPHETDQSLVPGFSKASYDLVEAPCKRPKDSEPLEPSPVYNALAHGWSVEQSSTVEYLNDHTGLSPQMTDDAAIKHLVSDSTFAYASGFDENILADPNAIGRAQIRSGSLTHSNQKSNSFRVQQEIILSLKGLRTHGINITSLPTASKPVFTATIMRGIRWRPTEMEQVPKFLHEKVSSTPLWSKLKCTVKQHEKDDTTFELLGRCHCTWGNLLEALYQQEATEFVQTIDCWFVELEFLLE